VQLLLLLVDHRSRAMSRNELQQQFWLETFVLETNLAGLIAELRRVLHDAADNPI
jgi:DNA-binding winged helix-turn-helix (wHTH) protein